MKYEEPEAKLKKLKELIIQLNNETVKLINYSALLEAGVRKSKCKPIELEQFEKEIDELLDHYDNVLKKRKIIN